MYYTSVLNLPLFAGKNCTYMLYAMCFIFIRNRFEHQFLLTANKVLGNRSLSLPQISRKILTIFWKIPKYSQIFLKCFVFSSIIQKNTAVYSGISVCIFLYGTVFFRILKYPGKYREISREISKYSGIYCQYFSGYFLKIQYYTAVCSGIFRLKMAWKRSELSSDI